MSTPEPLRNVQAAAAGAAEKVRQDIADDAAKGVAAGKAFEEKQLGWAKRNKVPLIVGFLLGCVFGVPIGAIIELARHAH